MSMEYHIANFGNLVLRNSRMLKPQAIFRPEDRVAFLFNDDGILAHGYAGRVSERAEKFRAGVGEPGGILDDLVYIEIEAGKVTPEIAEEINACLRYPGRAADLISRLSQDPDGTPEP